MTVCSRLQVFGLALFLVSSYDCASTDTSGSFPLDSVSPDVKKQKKYFFRACFKPDSLDYLKHLDVSIRHDGKALGYAQVWHKENTTSSPYCIANEFICGKIGAMIGLPVPPFAITDGPSSKVFFSSLDFNFSRALLPKIIPDLCFTALPGLCAGVLIFDIFIANEDRHDENLLVDQVSAPKEMHVYDHDQGLFGGSIYQGLERLRILRNHLAVTGGEIGGWRHVFLDEVNDPTLFDEWTGRVQQIPEYFIADICDYSRRELGISREEADGARDFLIHRRNQLDHIIKQHRTEFSNIANWPVELL